MTQEAEQKGSAARVAGVIEVAREFISGCAALADAWIDEGDNATGYLGFTCGAIDAFCQRAGLDAAESLAVLKGYIARVYAPDESEAKISGVLQAIRAIASDPKWAHSIGVGGEAAIKFMDSTFRAAAFFELSRLLAPKHPNEAD